MCCSGDAAASLPAAGGKDPRTAGREGKEQEEEWREVSLRFSAVGAGGPSLKTEAPLSKLCARKLFLCLLKRTSASCRSCSVRLA